MRADERYRRLVAHSALPPNPTGPVGVRIPMHAVHPFRFMTPTDSDACRPPWSERIAALAGKEWSCFSPNDPNVTAGEHACRRLHTILFHGR